MTATSSAEPRRASRPRRSRWRDGSRRAARCGAGRRAHRSTPSTSPSSSCTRSSSERERSPRWRSSTTTRPRRCGRWPAPATSSSLSPGGDAAHRRSPAAGRGVGAHHHPPGRGSSPARSHGRARAVAQRRPGRPPRRSPRARLPRALGAHPRLLRAPGAPRGRRRRARGVHRLLGRGPPRRGRRQRGRRRHGPHGVRDRDGEHPLVGPVQPGDLVLVHAGTAISVVDA